MAWAFESPYIYIYIYIYGLLAKLKISTTRKLQNTSEYTCTCPIYLGLY